MTYKRAEGQHARKFDGTRSKFRGFVQQVRPSSVYNTIAILMVLLKSDWLAPYFRGRHYYGLHHCSKEVAFILQL